MLFRSWDLATGRESSAYVLGEQVDATGLELSPDGKRLAVIAGLAVKVWDLEARKEIRALKGHTGMALAFSPSHFGPIIA